MTNFQFFKTQILPVYRRAFNAPVIVLLEERNHHLMRFPDAWAYYDPDTNEMIIRKECDSTAIRLHEGGHWINYCVYATLELVWEFFWWGCSIRNFAKKEARDATE